MAQNINLYEAPRRNDGAPFSGTGLIVLGVVGVAGLALLYGLNLQTNRQLADTLARFKREATRVEAMLAKIPSAADAVAQQRAREEADVAALEQIAARLSAGSLDGASGFTGQLRALGRATTDGLWLTGIRISNGHPALALEGRAVDAARVPALLAALRNEPLFQGLGLSAIELTSATGAAEGRRDAPLVHFRIRTPEGAAHAAAATAAAAPALPQPIAPARSAAAPTRRVATLGAGVRP